MCSPLAYNDPHNRLAAHRARLAGTLVNAEVILKITSPVYPIDAGAITANAFLEHIANAF